MDASPPLYAVRTVHAAGRPAVAVRRPRPLSRRGCRTAPPSAGTRRAAGAASPPRASPNSSSHTTRDIAVAAVRPVGASPRAASPPTAPALTGRSATPPCTRSTYFTRPSNSNRCRPTPQVDLGPARCPRSRTVLGLRPADVQLEHHQPQQRLARPFWRAPVGDLDRARAPRSRAASTSSASSARSSWRLRVAPSRSAASQATTPSSKPVLPADVDRRCGPGPWTTRPSTTVVASRLAVGREVVLDAALGAGARSRPGASRAPRSRHRGRVGIPSSTAGRAVRDAPPAASARATAARTAELVPGLLVERAPTACRSA